MKTVRIAVAGDFNPADASHTATDAAISAAARALGAAAEVTWVPTESIEASGASILAGFDGIWAASGSPYRSMTGALEAIRFARERGKPFVAT